MQTMFMLGEEERVNFSNASINEEKRQSCVRVNFGECRKIKHTCSSIAYLFNVNCSRWCSSWALESECIMYGKLNFNSVLEHFRPTMNIDFSFASAQNQSRARHQMTHRHRDRERSSIFLTSLMNLLFPRLRQRVGVFASFLVTSLGLFQVTGTRADFSSTTRKEWNPKFDACHSSCSFLCANAHSSVETLSTCENSTYNSSPSLNSIWNHKITSRKAPSQSSLSYTTAFRWERLQSFFFNVLKFTANVENVCAACNDHYHHHHRHRLAWSNELWMWILKLNTTTTTDRLIVVWWPPTFRICIVRMLLH